MNAQSDNLLLVIIIVILVVVIMWLNYRINKLADRIDILGGISFALIDGLSMENEALKDLIAVVQDIIDEECDESSDLKGAIDFLDDVDKELSVIPSNSGTSRERTTNTNKEN